MLTAREIIIQRRDANLDRLVVDFGGVQDVIELKFPTCARLLRKNLGMPSAKRESKTHGSAFPDKLVFIRSRHPAEMPGAGNGREFDLLRWEAVADAVADYGQLDAKIESLAQLRRIPGVRSELAMLSLSRAYVDRCVVKGGAWTSGIHILWWTAGRLTTEPDIKMTDLLHTTSQALRRQVELAKWSIVMLRLTFISDIGHHAQVNPHPVASLRDLLEEAAEATETVNLRKLLRWTRVVASRKIKKALPKQEYGRLATELHKELMPGS